MLSYLNKIKRKWNYEQTKGKSVQTEFVPIRICVEFQSLQLTDSDWIQLKEILRRHGIKRYEKLCMRLSAIQNDKEMIYTSHRLN